MAEYKRRKRKVKRKMRRGCFVSLISAVLVILSAIILFLTPIFNVEKITVTGNSRVNTQVVMKLSGIETGDNIFSVNSGKAKKKLSSLQYVEKVKIVKKYPDKIEIRITEGTVAAYIRSGEKIVGINNQGQVLCNISATGAENLVPVVKGLTVTESNMGKMAEAEDKESFEILLKFLKTFKEKGLSEKLTHFDITDEDYIVFRFEDKLKVEFGDVTHYENKFDYLIAFLEGAAETPQGIVNMVSENYTFRSVIS